MFEDMTSLQSPRKFRPKYVRGRGREAAKKYFFIGSAIKVNPLPPSSIRNFSVGIFKKKNLSLLARPSPLPS